MSYNDYKNLTDAKLLDALNNHQITQAEYDAEMIDRHGAQAPAPKCSASELADEQRANGMTYAAYRAAMLAHNPVIAQAIRTYSAKPDDRRTDIVPPRRV